MWDKKDWVSAGEILSTPLRNVWGVLIPASVAGGAGSGPGALLGVVGRNMW